MHNNSIVKYISLLAICFLVACEKSVSPLSIGETEYYYEERLSSLSYDEDGSFWIGSETGGLYNFKEDYRSSYDLGEDRIYKVLREPQAESESLLWLGVRNSGLQLWKMQGNDTLNKLKTYEINFKGSKYSAYDILSNEKTLYVATSQGLYEMDKTELSGELCLIYPSEEYLSKQNGYSFVCHNLCAYKDSVLYASTQNGVVQIDIKNAKQSKYLENTYINHVSIYNDLLYAVGDGCLFICSLEGEVIQEIEVANKPKVYYQVEGIHYLVGAQELLLSNDLEEFLSIRLRRSVPLGGRNIILPGKLKHFSYLLTDHALWRIANHMDVFKGNISIKAACKDEQAYYYLSSHNELFRQEVGRNKARCIYTFSEDLQIRWMDIIDGELYFYDSNEFKKMSVSKSWLNNMLFRKPKTLLTSHAKITTAAVKKINEDVYSYIGIQDGLVRVASSARVDTITAMNNVYVTSIFSHPSNDRLYFSTLNDGVFYLTPDSKVKRINETIGYSFLEDIISTNDHDPSLIILTNHHILSQNPTDSLLVKGYNKLVYLNDTLFYAIPELGLHKFYLSQGAIKDGGIHYPDIRFRPTAIFTHGNQLFLGSNLGVLSLQAGQEDKPAWISFEAPVSLSLFYLIAFLIIILALVLFFTLIFFRKKRLNLIQLERRKEDLENRISELASYYELIDREDDKELAYLQQKISEIDLDPKAKKVINIQFDELSLALINLNREATLFIPKKLQEQVEQIEATTAFEKEYLLAESRHAEQESDIKKMRNQIKKNQEWLLLHTTLLNAINELLEALDGCLELDNLNKDLFHKLALLKENSTKPLSYIQSKFEELYSSYQNIFAEESLRSIQAFVRTRINYLEDLSEPCTRVLLEQLDLINQSAQNMDRLELLRRLKTIEDQLLILFKRDEINLHIRAFKEKRQSILQTNEELVNKKFDKELDQLIEAATYEVVGQVEKLINEFYTLVSKTDDFILRDILKFNNFYNQQAKVLAVLLADPRVKRILIPGILGVYGNLNPVISRLINNRLKANEENLRKYYENKPNSVFTCSLLSFLD